MRIAVLADTHLISGLFKRLPSKGCDILQKAEAILHAGDLTGPAILAELNELAPTFAICGNNDHDLVDELPETRSLAFSGVSVAMVHDAGPRASRPQRLYRRFPDADIVVFGHSHVPCAEFGIGGQLLFNPGSPTQRRSQPHPSIGEFELDDGHVVSHRIVSL